MGYVLRAVSGTRLYDVLCRTVGRPFYGTDLVYDATRHQREPYGQYQVCAYQLRCTGSGSRV
eukprot:564712-Rhodomonas_salina.1